MTGARFIFIFHLSTMNSTKDFKTFFDAILKANTEAEEIRAALQLADHYQELLESHSTPLSFADTQETFLEGGVALASQYALDCLRDPLRTTRFIAGTYEAVKDQVQNRSNGPISLLYAGCGPAAPLVLPFLHRFDPAELQVYLLDITKSSLEAVKSLVSALELDSFIADYILADAITYEHPAAKGLDVIVSETMDKGLTREPQVRVMQNLMPQLAPDGVFVPQAISIFGEFTFYGKEPYFDISKDLEKLGPTYETFNKTLLFTIDEKIHNKQAFEFTSEAFKIPEDLSKTPDAAVFAEIQVYKERVLPKAKSLLSNSFCIRSLMGRENEHFKFHYFTKGTPGWELLFE